MQWRGQRVGGNWGLRQELHHMAFSVHHKVPVGFKLQMSSLINHRTCPVSVTSYKLFINHDIPAIIFLQFFILIKAERSLCAPVKVP